MKILREFLHGWFDYVVELIFRIIYFRIKPAVIPPIKNEILLLSAIELARCIKTGIFTCTEVVRAYIDRIQEVNPFVNAMVHDCFTDALEEASVLDRLLPTMTTRDFVTKPFLGVPFTAKESTLCKNMPCSFGIMAREGCKAKQDAAIIENMRNSGAILLGVTNVPQLNMWVETHNPIYGITKNPHNTKYNAGGSSGGEAALVALGGSPLGVGTDIGGSIRIPAFACGIFGHKCSNGLTDTEGMTFRTGADSATTMVTAGPLVRNACDLIPAVKVLLGPRAIVLELDKPVQVNSLKYYFIRSNEDPRCSPVRHDADCIQRAVFDHLRKMNYPVSEIEIPHLRFSSSLYKYWLSQEKGCFDRDITNRLYKVSAFRELVKYIFRYSDFSFSAIMNVISNQWMSQPNAEWARELTMDLKEYLVHRLGSDGVLIYLPWPHGPTMHHVNYFRPYNFAYTSIFNVLKFPVTQVPIGVNKDNLPMGIQIAAGPYMDRLCIAVAREFESVFGGWIEPESVY